VITWFCPECFAEVDPKAKRCPSCGAATDPDDRTYEQKLILALGHHLSDRRLLAARILGAIRSRAAVPRLAQAAMDPADPYVAAEAARSLALIDSEHPVVRRLRHDGPVLARAAVREVSPWPEEKAPSQS
jgi:HEAT repeat protein